MNYQRKIIIALGLLVGLLVIGTIGYLVLEKDNPRHGWQLLDAIYMTVITLTTAGHENLEMSDSGRIFTIVLLIGGLRLASGILQPKLVGFLENITQNRYGAQFAESIIQEGSPLDGISLRAASIPEQTGLVVIAIQDSDGTFLYNPPEIRKL